MVNKVIPGLKLIYHNASGVDLPDDPSFPFKLEGNFSPPEFMEITFVLIMHARRYSGGEEFIVRAMTKEALDRFIEMNDLRTHPRLRRMTIMGPNGLIEEITRSAK